LPAFAPERQWRLAWGAVVLAGLALAIADWGVLAVGAGIALDTGVVAGLIWLLRAPFTPSYAARPMLRRALVMVCVVVAMAAIATASSTLAVVVTIGAAVTSPQLRRLAHPVVQPRTPKDRNHLHL
jgi:hypothetical protein